jgi:hypothetical protein
VVSSALNVVNEATSVEHHRARSDDQQSQLLMEDDDEDVVTLEMYEKMVYENNDIIKWLAVDLQRVC